MPDVDAFYAKLEAADRLFRAAISRVESSCAPARSIAFGDVPTAVRRLLEDRQGPWGLRPLLLTRKRAEEASMQNESVVVRTAYEAYARGDLPTMLSFVGPDLECGPTSILHGGARTAGV